MFSFSQYPTFQVFLALAMAMVASAALLPFWIRLLRHRQIGQQVRADGPQGHLVKQGTPTMGGVVLLIVMVATVFLLGRPTRETILVILVVVASGLLGFIDDASKVVRERSLGLKPRAKMVVQGTIAVVFCLAAVNWAAIAPTVSIPLTDVVLDLGALTTIVPVGDLAFSIPWLYVLFVFVLMAGMSNAVNLTDGLDGLAGGTVMIAMTAMAAIAFRTDQLDSALLAAAAAGTCIGFLWFNSHPADIFMGDTGSLAFGAMLAALAVTTKTEVVSLIIGGIFVAEALSVIIQVVSFKSTGKRVFLMAPFHHHFEKKGWSETKVMVRFWIITGLLAAVGFAMFFTGSLR